MSIKNPDQLVAEFKKSGEFDRLRRVLLTQFKKDNSSLVNRVEDIVKGRLTSDGKLFNMGNDTLHAELMQEIDRYPFIDRAVADVPSFSDPDFRNGVRTSLAAILNDNSKRGEKDADLDESDSSGSDSDRDEEQTKAAKNEHPAQRPGSPSGTRSKNKNETGRKTGHESENEDPDS